MDQERKDPFGSVVDQFNAEKRSRAPPAPPREPFWKAWLPRGRSARPLDPAAFRALEGDLEDGLYACWWSTPDEARFEGSATARHMAASFEALHRLGSYAFADFLRALDGRHRDARRVPLLAGMAYLDVRAPEGQPLVLTISGEKGFRLHFPQSTARAAREALWAGLAAYAEALRGRARKEGLPLDAEEDVMPIEWWRVASGGLAKAEARGDRWRAFGVVDHLKGFRKVPLDALLLKEGRNVPTEFPTATMMRLHQPEMMRRMEQQAALVAGKREPL